MNTNQDSINFSLTLSGKKSNLSQNKSEVEIQKIGTSITISLS